MDVPLRDKGTSQSTRDPVINQATGKRPPVLSACGREPLTSKETLYVFVALRDCPLVTTCISKANVRCA